MSRLKLGFALIASGVVIVLALLFCIYPAVVLGVLLADTHLKREGQSCLVPIWFRSVAGRYQSWADAYQKSGYARSVDATNVAGTEWPMFGSVFFLVTADELQRQRKIDVRQEKIRGAIEKAADVIASPDTATWVKAKWGGNYLKRENVFYRMLLILGLSSYERLTGDTRHRMLMSEQRKSLAEELARARYHVLDDYPGECWPNDVLWAVAAIQRAAALEGTNHDALAQALVAMLDGPLKAEGMPAFKVDKDTGKVFETPRGCGNSGILTFAAELDKKTAVCWYRAYDERFWKQTAWLAGFTELPRGSNERYDDVDSGPVVFEFRPGGFRVRIGRVSLRNRRFKSLRTDGSGRAFDTGGCCLFVADAVWFLGAVRNGEARRGRRLPRGDGFVIFNDATEWRCPTAGTQAPAEIGNFAKEC